mgnify:CR=1 FL=1
MKKSKTTIYLFKLLIIYGFLFLGGLWNITGSYEFWMELLSGYVLITISLWAIYEHLKNKSQQPIRRYLIYFLFVIILTFLVEYIGVKTGYPFGEYSYTEKLKPLLFGVPLSIGFAWLASMLASFGIISSIEGLKNSSVIFKSVLTGLLMMIFDIALEPAAITQRFWYWEASSVPLINYLSWFVIGSIISFYGYRKKILWKDASPLLKHIYFAQIIFFLMSGIIANIFE